MLLLPGGGKEFCLESEVAGIFSAPGEAEQGMTDTWKMLAYGARVGE